MCVSSARPLTSPTANSQSWPGTRMSSPTASGLPASRPSASRPIAARAGHAPDGDEQLVGLDASSRRRARARTRRRAPRCVAEAPRRTSTPSSRSDASTCSLANGSSRSISRSPRWISVTFEPSAPQACAISTPTTPPPRIASRGGTALAVVASRFVQGCASRRPGMSGTSAVEPVATTTARRAGERLLSLDVDRQLAGDRARARARA